MNASDLDRLESALQIRLPARYRRMMEAYPFVQDSLAAEMLCDEVDVLLRWNAPFISPDSKRITPADFVQIGSDGGELSFYLEHSGTSHPIFCYDVESGNFDEYAPDIDAYVEHCARVEAGTESLPNEAGRLPEWKKWLGCASLLLLLAQFGYGVSRLILWLARVW